MQHTFMLVNNICTKILMNLQVASLFSLFEFVLLIQPPSVSPGLHEISLSTKYT